jgi:putative transposase
MSVLAYCLMPNHFHFVLMPKSDGDMSRWMHRLLTTHVRRYHRMHGTTGRIWQGRYKSFPVQREEYLYAVLRYVERNPLRARLVEKAEDWAWSSLRWWSRRKRPPFLVDDVVEKPGDWLWFVNQPQTQAELREIRRSVNKGTPFGPDSWRERVVRNYRLQGALRGVGRPRKERRSVPI